MLDQAIELARQTPVEKYAYGCDAMFLRINKNWGFKLFSTEKDRDKNYDRQNLAHEHGAAPAVGEKMFVTLPDNNSYYGFITECIVETYYDRHISEFDMYKDKEYANSELEEQMFRDDEYNNLMEILDDTTGSFDMHCQNVGYMPDGRMVAIDFSRSNHGW